MIQFPETARIEWEIAANAAKEVERLRARLDHDSKVSYELGKQRIRHEAQMLLQQEINAGATPELVIESLSDFLANPVVNTPRDLIEGVVKDEGLTILLGPSGTGKTTLGLQMLHSLQTGDPWLGQPVNKIDGSVGVMSYDMSAKLVMNWMTCFPDPKRVSVVDAHKRGNPLAVPEMRQKIVNHWKAMNTEVVLVDSFSAAFFGKDENDAAMTKQFYRDMKMFALTEVGAKALIVIVHSTEANPHKARGSTVQHDTADSIISVVTDQPTQLRHVRMVKYRAGLGQEQMTPVVIGAPDSVTHLVELDFGAMTLAGLKLPPNAPGAAMFTDMPDTYQDPDVDSDSDEEDDL